MLIEELIGNSAGIAAVRHTVARVARLNSASPPPVLISGETGTGKGLVARILHGMSPRRSVPIVEINCAAIPPTLLEAELFGYERGAFTDARQAKPGLLESAHRGTLFLDEIGLLSGDAQAKLLKVLEDRTVRRLGATRSEAIDVWIIAATNEELPVATRERRFREDLYHRLAVMTIALPPLREREGDALLIARHLLDRLGTRHGIGPKRFDAEAEQTIADHPWPGNVRELSNVVERAILLSDSDVLTAAALGLAVSSPSPRRRAERSVTPPAEVRRPPGPDVTELRAALQATQWNVSRAAEQLGITRNRLRYLMEKQRITPAASPTAPPGGLELDAPTADEPRSAHDTSSVSAASPLTTLRWEERRLTFFSLSVTASPLDRAAVHRVLESAVEKLQSFGGWIEEISGDGLVALFGTESTEDAPRRAALAALSISRDASLPESVHTAAAIHVADLLIGRIGERVALDEREKHEALSVLRALSALATPGATVLSDRASRALSRRFEVTALDAHSATTGTAYVLGRPERPDSRGTVRRSPFVDRTDELRTLQSLLGSVRHGRGHVVSIVGDAGIGKSRLVQEFQATLRSDEIRSVQSTCLSYGATIPYFPIQGLLGQAFEIEDTDSPATARAKVAEGLRSLGMDDVHGVPAILRLLSIRDETPVLSQLSQHALRHRMFETLTQLALRFAARTPLVIVVEDLHWIDRASAELLNALVEASAATRLLFITTTRPGHRPPWAGKSYFTQIALHPLPSEESRTIVHSVLDPTTIPDDLVAVVLAKGEGNPFFLEELALTVADLGTSGAEINVPETVEDVLHARIERLGDEARRVLETAAVVGREVSRGILHAMVGDVDAITPALAELVSDEFLFQAAGTDDSVYVFRHALTQEVAYRHLTVRARRRLHARAAEAIESVFAARLEQVYDRLAYHYSEASDVEKAIHYLVLAAESAARRHAHVEAVTAAAEARRRLHALPARADRDQRIIDLVLREAHSLHLLGRMTETMTLLLEQRDVVERLGDPRRSGPYHFWLARTYSVLGDRVHCASSLDRTIDAARHAGDDVTLGQAYFLLAFEDFWVGRLRAGIDHAREAVGRLSSTGEQWWLGMSHWAVALNCLVLGDLDQAREATNHIAELARAIGDPRLESCAAWMDGWIQATQGDCGSAIASCERAARQAKDHVSVLYAAGQLGAVYLESGEATRAVPHLERAIALAEQLSPAARQTQSRFMALLSEAYTALGDVDRAEAVAHEALRLADLVQHRYAAALANRALAAVAQQRGRRDDAARYLTTALAMFESIEAGPEVARTRARQNAFSATPSR